ncbi:MAG: hypothetical protein KIT31_07175 [Deltaproteobacteria bacterium]|nr:hypothetical protein [Deltaproteobacteria bacterium]
MSGISFFNLLMDDRISATEASAINRAQSRADDAMEVAKVHDRDARIDLTSTTRAGDRVRGDLALLFRVRERCFKPHIEHVSVHNAVVTQHRREYPNGRAKELDVSILGSHSAF